MNVYGYLMTIGWIYIIKNLKNDKICGLNNDFIGLLFLIIIIAFSKLFQKIIRNTWQGNASHGALLGGYLGFCLINYCDSSIDILNQISITLPILYLLIRLGNYYNNEHYSNRYLAILEGIFQGPICSLILNNFYLINPAKFFFIYSSIIRILSEFFREKFDSKNIIISILTIILSIYLESIFNIYGFFIALLILDRACKFYLDEKYISRNYGLNFSFLKTYNVKYIHFSCFIFILIMNSIYQIFDPFLLYCGCLSNLFDRFYYGYIIDYIPFLKYKFNLADIMIVLCLIINLFL